MESFSVNGITERNSSGTSEGSTTGYYEGEVNGDITIEYTEIKEEYLVKFCWPNEDVAPQITKYEETATYTGATPTKASESDNTYNYSYTFAGWSTNKDATTPIYTSNSIPNVTSNLTLYPVFTTNRSYKEYRINSIPSGVTVKYISGSSSYSSNATLSSSSVLHYGDVIKVSYNCLNDSSLESFYLKNISDFAVSGISQTSSSVSQNSFSGYRQGSVSNKISIIFNPVSYLNMNLSSNGYFVTGINNSFFTNIIIPSTYNGKKVVGIDASAFQENDIIKSVSMGDNIIDIYDNAFAWCSALSSVKLSNSLEYISEGAFKECSNLQNITYIGSKLEIIDREAFIGCPITSFNIPNSVTRIGEGAFCGTKLTSINIPSSVTFIANDAFYNCTKLTNVTIRSSSIWKSLTSKTSCGYLIYYATSITTYLDISYTSNYVTNNRTSVNTYGNDRVYTMKSSSGGSVGGC